MDNDPIGIRSALLSRLLKNPHLLLPGGAAWMKGWWYRIKFFLMCKQFSAGKFFRVYGCLTITGPGKVTLGDNCLIISNAIKPVCIRTLNRHAEVILGDSAGLNGTSIQCSKRVSIGNLSNIADAYITDTAAHSTEKSRRSQTVNDAVSMPVIIGNNVWISVQVVILHGVTIGENSVVGACSLVRKPVPENVLVAGIPLKLIRKIDD